MVYNVRPLICRLWGMIDVENMRCPFGCVPEHWVTNEEAYALFEKVLKIQKEAASGVRI